MVSYKPNERRRKTHSGANGVLLCGNSLLDGVLDDKVEEEVIAAQGAGDFAATLEMDEKLLVHELGDCISAI
jgi:hypothetical protein